MVNTVNESIRIELFSSLESFESREFSLASLWCVGLWAPRGSFHKTSPQSSTEKAPERPPLKTPEQRAFHISKKKKKKGTGWHTFV